MLKIEFVLQVEVRWEVKVCLSEFILLWKEKPCNYNQH